jgi:hypothetical protein
MIYFVKCLFPLFGCAVVMCCMSYTWKMSSITCSCTRVQRSKWVNYSLRFCGPIHTSVSDGSENPTVIKKESLYVIILEQKLAKYKHNMSSRMKHDVIKSGLLSWVLVHLLNWQL